MQAMAPRDHTATASTSTLCKLIAWERDGCTGEGLVLAHQADYIASLLHGRVGVSDWHNALKLGYDPGEEAYPPWLLAQVCRPGNIGIRIMIVIDAG